MAYTKSADRRLRHFPIASSPRAAYGALHPRVLEASMAEHLRCDERQPPKFAATGRRTRPGKARRSLATILRRSAQCLRIAPPDKTEGGAPTHRIIFTYPEGDDVPEAAKRMTRAFGLGLALVLSMRPSRNLCRVFAISGTHAGGAASLHFTVSLREFDRDSVRWRSRPPLARRSRTEAQPIGATLPLPLAFSGDD